ncbi:PAS domain-containing protein [Marinomonas fungiae]|uniref:PAS fold n=1 Tax=Marinomonas fungiae TaxID=1137284 RepID=A0A0K6IJT8_9GAMM|nr:PAS domain-containing protein [Marinomonas fungiae]CUB03375.1 PAS fold [Marinomonas fungiae]
MTLQHVPFCPTPIEWLDAFTGPFEIFNSLAKLLEHTGAISHWAMVLKNGQGIYVEEGHVKKISQTSIKSLEWFELPQAGYMGVPLYVDSNFIHDALPVINALFPIHPSVAPQNKLEDIADLVDQLPFLISILDTELRYQFVNETYEATYQLSRDEVIGKHVTEVAGPEQFEKVKGALARPWLESK